MSAAYGYEAYLRLALSCCHSMARHTIVLTDIEANLEQVFADLVCLDDKDDRPNNFNVREDILAQHTARETEIRQLS